MKVGFCKSEKVRYLVLRVEGAEYDVESSIPIFLKMIPAIEQDSVKPIGQGEVEFSFTEEVKPEIQKEIKLSIVNVIRNLLELTPSQMAAAFLQAKQQLDVLTSTYQTTLEVGKEAIRSLQVLERHIDKMYNLVGWATITTIVAIIVAVVTLFV